jgi:hypothetical protein
MALVAAAFTTAQVPTTATPTVIVSTSAEPVVEGKFQPNWQSLQQYQTPDWFRDAKFGIWAHWGPQCEPERGDWYAREMYSQGNFKYNEHLKLYGHPSTNGFTAQDARFTTKGGALYAFIMSAPTNTVSLKSLGTNATLLEKPIAEVTLLGSEENLNWSQTADALVIEKPQHLPSDIAVAFKITPKS